MSEIPFVNALGDAIEHSAAARIAGRRKRIRRRITFGALSFAIAATGVAAASGVLWNSPEQLAASSVSCYDKADLAHSGITVMTPGDEAPIAACRRVLGDGPLVACAETQILVFPGGPGTCKRLGLAEVPAGYAPARAQFNRLAEAIMALERTRDCWAPDELAARAQALLDGSTAWRGWKTEVNRNFVEGPCGTVSSANGDGSRSVEAAFDETRRVVSVTLTISHSTEQLVNGVGGRLMDESGERCYSVAEVEDLAREHLAPAQRPISFETRTPEPGVEIIDARQARLDEGCAVITQLRPVENDRAIVVEIWAGR